MKPETFINKLNSSLKSGIHDEEILSKEARFLRSTYLLKTLNNLSRILNLFDFKDMILFKNNVPYINIDDILIKLDTMLFLKHTGRKFLSQSIKSIEFIKYLKLNPKIIIDIGSCWGEYTLFYAKEFPKCKIFSVEGSPLNFQNLLHNIKINHQFKNIKPFNLIISDTDGIGEISNNLNTMNKTRDLSENNDKNFVKLRSKKLSTFLYENRLSKIDFIKIDIEGSELKLLHQLKTNFIKMLQVELISKNTIEKNLEFLKVLSEDFNFYNIENFKLLSFTNLNVFVKQKLLANPTVDLFLVSKKIDKF